VRARTSIYPKELRYLSPADKGRIITERADTESRLGHSICGRYLGTSDDHPNVCWKTPGHPGTHL